MDRRQMLHDLLLEITPKVYFQPPANVKMEYPCIRYELNAQISKFADNGPYLHTKGYQLTIIKRDSGSDIFDAISALPLCSFTQRFVTENLYHDVFSIYF